MRITLVSPYDFAVPGGVNEHVRNLALGLRAGGHEVHTLAPASERVIDHPDFHSLGHPIKIPVNDSVARVTFRLRLRTSTYRLLERSEVIHFHEPLLPSTPLSLLGHSRAANVGTFHAYADRSLGYRLGRRLLVRYLRRLDATIAVSEPASDFLRQYFPEADPLLIPNGVDTAFFRPDAESPERLRRTGTTILFVGRLEKRKGVLELVRAFAAVAQARPGSRLVLVGDGPLRRPVEAEIRRLRLAGVSLEGQVPRALLPSYYAGADLFCAPSLAAESFGIVLLEAMASGLPVVASSVAGYAALVEAETEALLVAPGDTDRLSAALLRAAADDDLRRRLARAGLAKAELHSWAAVIPRVEGVYARALQVRGRREGSRAARRPWASADPTAEPAQGQRDQALQLLADEQ